MREELMQARKPYVIPPEPPKLSTLEAIRQRLYGRPLAEQDRIIKAFCTQVAALAFLASLSEPDIAPKLSDAELIRRQSELDYQWRCKLDADAERAARLAADKSCHTGPADPDWPDRRSDRSWIWGDKAR
jgi:hypothetical protein